ncbi:MAG: hypothetical protein QOJ57_3015, partial [Thermoleophilaceae bacterium]|nr:hypothetical protein [Thermoleophilaceae bacterium]
DPGVQRVLQVVQKSGNSFGENKRRRGRWTRELDFEVKDARKEPVDVLWFVGDYASFDPRSQQISRLMAQLLTVRASTSGSFTTASATPAATFAGSGRRAYSSRWPPRTSRRSPSVSSSESSPLIRTRSTRCETSIRTWAATGRCCTTRAC